MLQRFDVAIDTAVDRLSINEYAVLGRRYRWREDALPARHKYFLVYEARYDGGNIRSAIKKGKTAVISELRTDGFFPIQACAELLADKVIEMFDSGGDHAAELFYDDRTAILPDEAEEDDDKA